MRSMHRQSFTVYKRGDGVAASFYRTLILTCRTELRNMWTINAMARHKTPYENAGGKKKIQIEFQLQFHHR